ncbi:MAG: hypothetical protein WAU00_22875 [Caldilinea sp.]
MPTQQTMLEAHIQFELQRWQGEALRSTVQEEVAALYEWSETVRLNEMVQPAQVMGLIQRIVIAMPVSAEIIASIRESVQVAFEFLQEDTTPVEALLPRELFDRIVTDVISMEALRREITHQVVSSSVYTQLISNILYQGIKSFIVSENSLTKKIPGASSLFKLGQNALNNAAPQMEKNIDRQLVAFIHDNIQETIGESERFLNGAVNEQELRKVADELWATNAQTSMATLTSYTDAASVDAVVELVTAFWLHFRTTPMFLEIAEQLVRNFFLRHGKKPIRTFLEEVGVTPDRVVEEVYAFAAPAAATAVERGYLEQRIRARLAAFYNSYAA